MTIDNMAEHLDDILLEYPNYWQLTSITEVYEAGEDCYKVIAYSEGEDQYVVRLIHRTESKVLDTYLLDRNMERI